MTYRAVCQTCSFVGRDFAVRSLAANDGDEHEEMMGRADDVQHHRTKVVRSGGKEAV
jgi:hypothetical protein